MIHQFKAVINSVCPLEEEAWNSMEQYMSIRVLKKYELLWRTGEVCRHLVFVGRGLFRNFYVVNEKEITLRFFSENSMLLSYKSFITQQPSDIAFEALEESEIITVPRVAVYDLYDKYKSVDRLGRLMAQRGFVEIQNLRNLLATLTPEEKYLQMLKEQPQIMERVSQISRIRKKAGK